MVFKAWDDSSESHEEKKLVREIGFFASKRRVFSSVDASDNSALVSSKSYSFQCS